MRSLAESVERSIEAALALLADSGARREEGPGRTSIIHIGTIAVKVNPNAKWLDTKWLDSANARARAARESGAIIEASAEFSASMVAMDIDPARQAPYRADIIVSVENTLQIVDFESILITAPPETAHEPGADARYAVCRLVPDTKTIAEMEQRRSVDPDHGAADLVALWANEYVNGDAGNRATLIQSTPDGEAWARQWGTTAFEAASA